MTEWAPATEAEVAMRDALRADDQELYFRILARVELLLPVSSEAIAGRAPMGWGTWTAGNRTHVLAFTSSEAMRACLAEHAGSARRIPYYELAAAWPNLDWWLAVNPGLPIEGYLPSWFVSQLARGDVRLPGRGSGGQPPAARAETLARPAREPLRLPGRAGRARVPVPARSRPEMLLEAVPAPAEPATAGSPTAVTSTTAVTPTTAEPPAASLPPVVPAQSAPPGRATPASGPAGSGIAATRPAPAEPALAEAFPEPAPAAAPEPGAASAVEAGSQPAATGSAAGEDPLAGFKPANDLEAQLAQAASSGSPDGFLSVLLLAKVLLPVAEGADPSVRPGEAGFAWRTETIDDQPYVAVFTSPERLDAHLDAPVEVIAIRFMQLIRAWPDETWSLAVNPGTPIGATLPGPQIAGLVSSAAEVGLDDDAGEAGESATAGAAGGAGSQAATPVSMQKVIAPSQVGWYLERGYDRVSGFVHRTQELAHLKTPATLVAGLGLRYEGSPFDVEADEVFVLRWQAYCPHLYRIPYGGRTEAAMTAMQGWVIERAPFRGNGFAPADSGDVIAEFKVDSIRLPHGAELWRLGRDGDQRLVAKLDADGPTWQRVEGA